MIDISDAERQLILEILQKHVPDRQVMALGSRASGQAKPYSDLDLAIMGDSPLSFKSLALLKDAFAESDLPFRVDIMQWCQTSPEFKKTVRPHLQPLRRAS